MLQLRDGVVSRTGLFASFRAYNIFDFNETLMLFALRCVPFVYEILLLYGCHRIFPVYRTSTAISLNTESTRSAHTDGCTELANPSTSQFIGLDLHINSL